jgi:hypothetical protein
VKTISMDTRFSTAPLPSYHYKRFLFWAFCDRKSKSNLSKDILVARTEANETLIERKLLDYATEYNLSVEELSDLILQANIDGLSFAKLHEGLKEKVLKT